MFRHHVTIHPPAVGEPDQRTQTDFVDTGATQPVRRFQAEEEILFLALQVVSGVRRLVVGFLIDHDAVQPERFELRVLLLRQRLHFHLQRRKLTTNGGKVPTEIVHSHFPLMFARDQQKMFKAHFTDGRTLTGNLSLIERFTLDAVAHGETAVGAVIGAQVGEIERHVETHRVAKPLAGKPLRSLGHRFEVGAGRRGEQSH